VVIPVFGTEAYLPACLDSLRGQSLDNFEVIVIDDGSPEDVGAVASAVPGLAGRLTVIEHQTNQGALAARLTGVAKARGEYLSFIDSDDTVDPRFLELLYGVAIRHDADVVQCAMTLVEPDGSSYVWNPGGNSPEIRLGSPVAELMCGRLANMFCNKLWRTETFRRATRSVQHAVARINFGEDLLFVFQLLQECRSYAQLEDVLYRYEYRAGSATTKDGTAARAQRLTDLRMIYETIEQRLAACDEPEDLKQTFVYREFTMVAQELLEKDPAIGMTLRLPERPLPFPV
jgi:glycosyltransferase involved in cell wall biosynthesis